MLRREMLIGVLAISACATRAAQAPTRILLIASLHGFHRDNALYSYDDLYGRIRGFAPTAIGVELRPEDVGQPREYLAGFYPREMIELSLEYADRVTGIDWLGQDVEGRLVPPTYFAESEITRLQRAYGADAAFASPALEAIQGEQRAFVQTATAATLNDGRYDEIAARYHGQFAEQVRGTPYQPLSDFNRARDAHISANAVNLVRDNPGGRVAIVVGADHRGPAQAALTQALGATIVFEPV